MEGAEEITLDSLLADEDLQSELRALGWSHDHHENSRVERSKVARPAHTVIGQGAEQVNFLESHFDFDVDSIQSIGIIDESAIQLDEQDMNDPELLSLYQSMHDGHEDPRQKAHSTLSLEPPMTTSTVHSALVNTGETQPPRRQNQAIPVSPSQVTAAANEILNASQLTAEDAKRKALHFKRQGNNEEALKWFRLSKQLNQTVKADPSTSLPKPSVAPTSSVTANSREITPKKSSVAPARPPRSSSSSTTTAAASSSTTNSSSRLTSNRAVLEQDQVTLFENALLEASGYFLKEAKRLRERQETKAAIEKMKKYKYYQQELSVLQSRKQIGVDLVPLFSWQTHRLEEKVEHMDIAENEMRIEIASLTGIEGLISSQNHRSIGLRINLGRSSEKEDEVVEVPFVRSEDSQSVNYDFCRSYPVLKRSKLAQQLYSRKKITVELLMNRGGLVSFFQKGSYPVAMAILPLAELLQKCSTGGDLPLYAVEKNSTDGSVKKGKLIGGVLKMTATIRSPLVSPEIKVVEERELVIEPWPSSTGTPSAAATAMSPDSEDTITSGPPAMPSSSINNTPTASNGGENSAKLTELSQQLSEKEKNDPEDLEFLESNDVLEAEIASLEQLMPSLRDEDEVIQKQMRLQMLRAKLQILVFSVQNETLSLEEYLDRLRLRIQSDKKMMFYQKYLNTAESKALAIKVMKRVKIMEQEIKNAEESMAGGEEG